MSEPVPMPFVARRAASSDADAAAPWQAGDQYDGFETIDPEAHYIPRPSTRQWNLHPHDMPLPDNWPAWRILTRHRCTCRKPGRVLVTERAGNDGITWVFIKPERIPTALGESDDDELAMPMHNDQASGTPHIEVTSCKCGQHYLVLVFDDLVQLVPARPRHAQTVRS